MKNERRIAKLTPRVMGGLIDLILILSIATVLMFLWGLMVGASGNERHLSAEQADALWTGRGLLVGLLVDFLYTVGMQNSSTRATFGQKWMGLQIVSDTYKDAGFGKLILRYVVSLFSSLILKIGFFIALFTNKKQTLHDLVASTIVVIKMDESSSITKDNEPNFDLNSPFEKTNKLTQPSSDFQFSASTSKVTKQVDDISVGGINKNEKKYMNVNEPVAVVQHEKRIAMQDKNTEPLAEDWESALVEFDQDERVKGLWAKIFAENNGDENKSKAQYIKIRALEIAALRRKRIDEGRANIYAQASNEMCIRNGALTQIEANGTLPIYKLANGNFAIYASWKYKIYSDRESINNALAMHQRCELFSKDGFLEDVGS